MIFFASFHHSHHYGLQSTIKHLWWSDCFLAEFFSCFYTCFFKYFLIFWLLGSIVKIFMGDSIKTNFSLCLGFLLIYHILKICTLFLDDVNKKKKYFSFCVLVTYFMIFYKTKIIIACIYGSLIDIISIIDINYKYTITSTLKPPVLYG